MKAIQTVDETERAAAVAAEEAVAVEAAAAAKEAATAVRATALQAAIQNVRRSRALYQPKESPPTGGADSQNRVWYIPSSKNSPPHRDDDDRSTASSRKSTTHSSTEKVLERLISLNLRSNVPQVVVEPFSGDFTKYRAFVKTFDATVAARAENDEERLLYLMQYTS